MSSVIKRQSQSVYLNRSVSNHGNYSDYNMQKISHVDQLFLKNQEIYKNLKLKLQGITKADRNITNNINIIRPLYYASIQSANKWERRDSQRLNYGQNQIQKISQRQIQIINKSNKQLAQIKYQTQKSNASSPIKIQKDLYDSLVKRQVNMTQTPYNAFIRKGQNSTQNNISKQLIRLKSVESNYQNYHFNEQQNSLYSSYYQKLNQRCFLKQSKSGKKDKNVYLIDIHKNMNNDVSSIYQQTNQPNRKTNQIYYPRSSSKISIKQSNQIYNNQIIPISYKKQLQKLQKLQKQQRQQKLQLLQKLQRQQRKQRLQEDYLINRSYQNAYLQNIQKINFNELNRRKEQIQKIYKQLKQQEDKIQRQYQQYKKGLGYDTMQSNKYNTKPKQIIKQINLNQIIKKSQHKKKQSSISPRQKSKNKQIISPSSSPTKKQLSASKLNKSISPKIQLSISPTAQNNKSIIQKTSEPHLRMSSIMKNTIQQSSGVIEQNQLQEKQKTTNFNNIIIMNKTMPLNKQQNKQLSGLSKINEKNSHKAKCYIYIPFNKLYKSPILQMKSSNVLILARQSKLTNLKTNQSKIIDGKKYKFLSNIQTDEQGLIKRILSKQKKTHNLAIVGGQNTLKKKLHMAFIAHGFDKILKTMNKKQFNFMNLSISYNQLVDKVNGQQIRIENFIEIDDENIPQVKIGLMKIQKTIQQIYNAIKKGYNNDNQSNFVNKVGNNCLINKQIKILRRTKLCLSSGKQVICDCHFLSINHFNYQLMKTISVDDIIWSINPLVKNYDDVAKTLAEIVKYQQFR